MQLEQVRSQLEQRIDLLLTEHELERNYALLEGQDQERKRIAQDLHDRLGSLLSTVRLYYSDFESKRNKEIPNEDSYKKARSLLDEAAEEVRRISHDMYSGMLLKFGLKGTS